MATTGTISSPGVGSNLDVNGIIQQLMSVEQQPLVLLAQKEASFQAKLTAIGNLKGALSSFQTSVQALSDISKFQAMQVNVADTTIATATANTTAAAGSYSLEVTKLAQAQKLVAAGQSSTATAIGVGTITFDFGTISGGTFDATAGKYTGSTFTTNGNGTKTVTIDNTNNSLAGIRDAINAASIGVTASIINDGSATPYRLVLTDNNTGVANSIKISVAGDVALQTLLNHDPGGAPAAQAFSETVTAQNAAFKVDGISASKSTNSVDDVIPGVTLSLKKTNTNSPITVSVAQDTATVTASINQFVTAYNQINKTLTDLSSYNTTTRQGAILNGDASVRTIQAQIRGLLSQNIAGGASAYTVLSQVGVSIQKDGTMAVDGSKLNSAISTNFKDVAGLFAAVGKSSDSLISYTGSTSATTSGSYDLNITRLATQGTTTGNAVAGLTIDNTNDTLQVLLDGTTATIQLTQKVYASADALAAEVQSKINGASAFSSIGSSVKVTQSAGILTMTSQRYGSGSSISVTGGNGQTNLLGSATNVLGLDVAGTIGGKAATGSGQFLTGASGTSVEGLKLLITGTSTGARGTVNFSKGYAYQYSQLLTSILDSTGPVSSRTDGLNASIKSLEDQKDKVSARLATLEKRYRAQFTALDVAIGNMKKTSDFLTQQLASLSKNSG